MTLKSKIEANLREIEALKSSSQTNFDKLKLEEANIIENAKRKAREILLDAKEDANEMIRKLEKSNTSKESNSVRNDLNMKIKTEIPKKQPVSLPKIFWFYP